MKDYTSLVNGKYETGITDSDPVFVGPANTYPVTFILKNSGTQKLRLCKAIKIFASIGLKEAKDFIDEASHQPVMFRKRATISQISQFKQDLGDIDAQYQFNDIEISRNRKLIEIGICSKEDIIDEICSANIQNIMIDGFNVELISQMLRRAYSEIDQDKLKEIYNEVTLH